MKQEHQIWLEWNRMDNRFKIDGLFQYPLLSKWQYIYYVSYQTDEISLVHFRHDLYDPYHWEILCLKGDLFEDVERFKSKQEAEIKIKKYLEPSYWDRLVKYYNNNLGFFKVFQNHI